MFVNKVFKQPYCITGILGATRTHSRLWKTIFCRGGTGRSFCKQYLYDSSWVAIKLTRIMCFHSHRKWRRGI